jgi:hypothetical protein
VRHDAVVVLESSKLDDEKLTFDVQVLEGNLNSADGPAVVFIDIIGLPRTPLSFAGVARRTARERMPRTVWRGSNAAIAAQTMRGPVLSETSIPAGFAWQGRIIEL